MQYPLISEYIEAIRSAEDNFDQYSALRPVLDGKGNPVMSSEKVRWSWRIMTGCLFPPCKVSKRAN